MGCMWKRLAPWRFSCSRSAGQRADHVTGRRRTLQHQRPRKRNRRRSSPPPPPDAEPAKPDGFTIAGFTFKVGGRVKLDIIRDFDPIGSEDSFDPRTIPVDGSEGGNSQLHARETRLFLDMRGPVEGKELRMYVETDFYGSGNVLRLRHAYGSYGGLLAGQTWSTFLDDNNFPNTIDFESPMAFPSIRQAQLRWTQKLGAKVSWSAAVEDNKSAIVPARRRPGRPNIRCRTWQHASASTVRAGMPSPPSFSAGRTLPANRR